MQRSPRGYGYTLSREGGIQWVYFKWRRLIIQVLMSARCAGRSCGFGLLIKLYIM